MDNMFQLLVWLSLLYFSVQVVVAGTSKNYHEETVVADVHPAPLHPSNVQVLYGVNWLCWKIVEDTPCSLHKRLRKFTDLGLSQVAHSRKKAHQMSHQIVKDNDPKVAQMGFLVLCGRHFVAFITKDSRDCVRLCYFVHSWSRTPFRNRNNNSKWIV